MMRLTIWTALLVRTQDTSQTSQSEDTFLILTVLLVRTEETIQFSQSEYTILNNGFLIF